MNEQSIEPLEGRAAFGGFIGPLRLVDLVRSTAPWLFNGHQRFAATPDTQGARLWQHAEHPLGWLAILRRHTMVVATAEPSIEQWTDYFALCVACHFASCASYVPTDVDTKIRAHLWFMTRNEEERDAMVRVALATTSWDLSGASTRHIATGEHGLVSGHNGECLSVLNGGMLAMFKANDEPRAALLEAAVEQELVREAAAFNAVATRRGGEIELLKLCAAVTHNAGDVDQGLSAELGKKLAPEQRIRFARLVHEGPERYSGAYTRAARLYREVMASEGHRNYPLRDIRVLRSDPIFLLPVSPFLDDWGRTLATHAAFNDADRAAIAEGLLVATRKVSGQQGYYRALAGFAEAVSGGIESSAIVSRMGNAAKKELRDSDLRKRIAVPKHSFESSMAKRVRALLG